MTQVVTSYIRTTGSASARRTETIQWDLLGRPQAMSLYARFIMLGYSAGNNTINILLIGDYPSGTSRGIGFDVAATPLHRLIYNNGMNQVSVTASPLPSVGDRVELLGTLTGAGVIQLTQVVNEGTPVVSSTATAVLPASWSTQRVRSLAGARAHGIAIREFHIVRGVVSLQSMRRLAGVARA